MTFHLSQSIAGEAPHVSCDRCYKRWPMPENARWDYKVRRQAVLENGLEVRAHGKHHCKECAEANRRDLRHVKGGRIFREDEKDARIAELRRALNHYDLVRRDPSGIENGATHEAVEWVFKAAREIAATLRDDDPPGPR